MVDTEPPALVPDTAENLTDDSDWDSALGVVRLPPIFCALIYEALLF
jgi:hypothetical protein